MSSPAECKIPEEMRADLVEKMARASYETRNKGLKNCWGWDDSGLDYEHPGVREQHYEAADAALTAIEPALAELVGALEEVRQACLFDDDDGQIGVAEDVVIPLELFSRICTALSKYRRTT